MIAHTPQYPTMEDAFISLQIALVVLAAWIYMFQRLSMANGATLLTSDPK